MSNIRTDDPNEDSPLLAPTDEASTPRAAAAEEGSHPPPIKNDHQEERPKKSWVEACPVLDTIKNSVFAWVSILVGLIAAISKIKIEDSKVDHGFPTWNVHLGRLFGRKTSSKKSLP